MINRVNEVVIQIIYTILIFFSYIGNILIQISKSSLSSTVKLYKLLVRKLINSLKYVGLKMSRVVVAGYLNLIQKYKIFVQKALKFKKNLFLNKSVQNDSPLKKSLKLDHMVMRPVISQSFDIKIDFLSKLKLKYFLIGFISTFIIFSSFFIIKGLQSLPDPILLGLVNYPVSSKLYDRNGILLYEFFDTQKRTPIKIESLPKHLVDALISIEDREFYFHQGISPIGGVLRAVKDSIRTKKIQGGSTLTQQLVKMSFLTNEKTLIRKLKEAVLAVWTESKFSKNQILEMYLNDAPFGGSIYGIEQSAQAYFGKSSRDLDIYESAFLVGLPRSPTQYSPYSNPMLARVRYLQVLKAMQESKYIDSSTYQKGLSHEFNILPLREPIVSPHFVFYMRDLLEKEFGRLRLETGGLRITTSLDSQFQSKLQNILTYELEKVSNLKISNGAILVISPQNGEILAMLGSKDYFEPKVGAFNVLTSKRQPGSSIKPILYSLALQKGFSPASILIDAPSIFKSGTQVYRPQNYDGKYHGRVPLRYALANSYNIPAVRLINELGVANFISYAKKFGITTWVPESRFGLALSLGAGEVIPVELAYAYATFANNGLQVNPNPIKEVSDYHGEILRRAKPNSTKQLIPKEVAFQISNILSDNFARKTSFGDSQSLQFSPRQVAVKTGTTNDKRDNWTIGYNQNLLTLVWVGNNDNTTMSQALASGLTGAAPIWKETMEEAFVNENEWLGNIKVKFDAPNSIVKKKCFWQRDEYFLKDNIHDCAVNNISINSKLTPQNATN